MNKDWQGYAAMAAAAYTKDLLCRIIPRQMEAEKRLVTSFLLVSLANSPVTNNPTNRLFSQGRLE